MKKREKKVEEKEIKEESAEEKLESYTIEDDNEEKIEEFKFTEEKQKNKTTLILNIVFVVVLVLAVIIVTDVMMVGKYKKNPIFAIHTKTYDDGGTKEYLGIGYKVIKYNQKQGRRDIVIGPWGLKYDSAAENIEAIDLAIEFNEDEVKSYKKYDGKFMRVSGVLTNVSLNENNITISYEDEDGKYTFDIVCDMATNKKQLKNFITDIRVTAIGTVSSYDYKTPDNNPTLHLKDCFAEQDQVD